ncbi:two-component system, chemotaxis family, response regulator CheB [Halanaerobium congolense]|jgi:two-component system chemotaxis response regulator CheB|uniref:Protein-glutamate methylesterase/protein-glutamine glutaminase n=1 Tax=Halanaerobium congolense TaxID=54121 RepID=A0A1G6NKP1_9FIRM|nr:MULTISPECIES: chemotaxis response regulator protein-glutamate methylesterase [Halanaerobium]KXS48327.1 MAG: two-component system, chemotaxis family, response regulator CheB [Halanaerobium sp. T82-1]OEG62812.1 MAG: chemotaxis response regulator protein-glutamate methylesterase [Halanaerobium sp. MDAL1]PTX16468.1 two-component system chemotaxis response regulator CheB [Halanaerobium congolense]PUU86608.1 MAG: Chemotaxis response regulator protein-glutamate methylesterase [Halanaerobium sp.]PU
MLKVMICDDSAFMRKIFSDTVESDSELTVIDTAYNGQNLLDKLEKNKADLLMLDIEMPVLNGLETLKIVKEKYSDLPVIMVSALDNSETVFKALDLGAFDFIPKPGGSISLNIDSIKEELISKLKAAHQSKKERVTKPVQITKQIKEFPIVAIGTSSGGPRALTTLLSDIPDNFPAAFVIVQHMPAGFTKTLAERLNTVSGLNIKEAETGDKLEKGKGLLAPGDYHLEINHKGKVELNQKPKEHGVRPSVDYMLKSLARNFNKKRITACILTGMGRDGAAGMKELITGGAYGIIEAKESALVYGMPSAAAAKGAYDEILNINDIAARLIEIVEG